jgi:hypothetical protein
MARCGRPRPRNAIAQFDSTATRFSKPVSANRWTVSHGHQAVNPDTRRRPMLAIACADYEHLWVSGQRAIRQHLDAAGTIDRCARRLGDDASEWRGLDARRPDLGARLDPPQLRLVGIGLDATRSTPVTIVPR